MITCHDHQLVEIVIGGLRGYSPAVREGLHTRVFGVFTTCTTRCGFVNVAFGFAVRKASRHQLYKHVNAHVYLGV